MREVDTIYCVGQECPVYEVPGPTARPTTLYATSCIARTCRAASRWRRRKAFPNHSESSTRKRLKLCADFKRTGLDSNR